jgi:dTDP-4-dehydrorhamnose 3,5-epimerase
VTLTDDTEVLYMICGEYTPSLARGVRWNDPAFAIEWPVEPTAMSTRDRAYPDYAL